MGTITRHFIQERNFVLTSLAGNIDRDTLNQHVDELTADSIALGLKSFDELADCTCVTDVSSLTVEDIMASAAREHERIPNIKGKLAIWATSSDVIEAAKAYAMSSEFYRYHVKIFRDLDEALLWLGITDLKDQIAHFRAEYLPKAS